jgi:hypothetical protein
MSWETRPYQIDRVLYLPRSLGSQLLSALPPPVLGACSSPVLGRGANRGIASQGQGQRRRQNELRAAFRPLRSDLNLYLSTYCPSAPLSF